MRKKGFLALILMLAVSMVLAACGGNNGGGNDGGGDSAGGNGSPDQLSLLTGGTGGTYFPLGGEIATIIKDETGIEANAQSSGASVENMQTLKDGDADLAFTQTDIASYATEGKLMFEDAKVDNVQAIGTLYPETIQIVALKDSGINSVEDLKGKKVSVGAPGSGTYANAEQVLEIHGISMDDIEAQHLAFDESTEGIQDGNIDAAFITSGTPTGSVEALSATKAVKIIPIEESKAEELQEKYPYYAKDVVKSGTYKLEEDVPTVAVLAMLVVRADLDEDYVYDITKAIFENTDKITHAKGEMITAESALDGVGIDLHPGAEKYFKEKGLK
ncbi:TAXI family TRAP transporter solute-binding subunit [Pseudalkalibacillus caeni]|uniref:TAXI family TRAP transporter solute-binding subunit n=1 Tax=Exobacillus caeni TaxID=2574798 RepID=A0A5R9F241_9BACL|nr:TAXI family TRAP transporter solute-binding subunit [Pseudalkalibacillus caeni]TLS36599.1 TAXI family TRAP transporter solute-binding subunit [Pseudalkalibacillus caeni]